MGRIILFTGGCRSGKSARALALAEAQAGPRVYVATCPVIDEEMNLRIERHRQERAGRGWRTVEEERDLAGAVAAAGAPGGVVLVDCLSLWVNNLLYERSRGGGALEEAEIARRCAALLEACASAAATVIFVTNEVGLGLVPADAETRHYRDLLGRCNQVIAAGADEVYFVACGIPLILKKKD